jgi:hypothetical protein
MKLSTSTKELRNPLSARQVLELEVLNEQLVFRDRNSCFRFHRYLGCLYSHNGSLFRNKEEEPHVAYILFDRDVCLAMYLHYRVP